MDICGLTGFVIVSMIAMMSTAFMMVGSNALQVSVLGSTGIFLGILSEFVIIYHLVYGDPLDEQHNS